METKAQTPTTAALARQTPGGALATLTVADLTDEQLTQALDFINAKVHGLRASDGERESIVHALNTSVKDGRLDMSEFESRVNSALTAQTFAELDHLIGDLPYHLDLPQTQTLSASTELAKSEQTSEEVYYGGGGGALEYMLVAMILTVILTTLVAVGFSMLGEDTQASIQSFVDSVLGPLATK